MCDRKKSVFDGFKQYIPKEHQDDFEKQWGTLSRLSTALKELLPKWEEDRKAYAKWKKKKKFHDDEVVRINTEIGSTTSGLKKELKDARDISINASSSDNKAYAAEVAARTKQIELVEEKLIKKQDEKANLEKPGPEPEFTHPAKLKDALNELAGFHNGFNGRGWRDVVPTDTAENEAQINERIHDKVKDEFLAEAENQYVAFLEKNTTEQWNILQNIAEGARVGFRFRETTDVGHLQMPKDLRENMKSVPNLRVIRKNADGIILEGNNKIYVLTGPSVKGKEVESNLGIYDKVDGDGNLAQPGTPAAADFSIPQTNPNQQATVLSMQIL